MVCVEVPGNGSGCYNRHSNIYCPFLLAVTTTISPILVSLPAPIHSHSSDKETEGQMDSYELSKDMQTITVIEI